MSKTLKTIEDIFQGQINRDQIRYIFDAATHFLNEHKKEVFGGVMALALAAGALYVATRYDPDQLRKQNMENTRTYNNR